MALSDADVAKQLKHMMAFIEQEANEKAEEIDAKAEEEFNIEKGRLVQQGRLKIMEYFDRKEKQIDLQKKIQSSNMLNQARLRVLKAQEEHVQNVLDEARAQLKELRNDKAKYEEVMRKLILQGLYQLLEPTVMVRCRQDDLALVDSLIPKLQETYRKEAKRDVKIELVRDNVLSKDVAGGVEMAAMAGKIRIENTLETRLDLITEHVLPEIRETLFGSNPNRRFTD